MRSPLAPARALLLALLLAGGVSSSVAAEEDLGLLLRDYETALALRDEPGTEAQRAALYRIADLRSATGRAALERVLEEQGRGDRRRASVVLEAIVRRGTPQDLDRVIAWVEARHDPILLETLDRVVAAAAEPATREHARTAALARAVPPVKAMIARALGLTGDAAGVLPLLLLLREPDLRVRFEAMTALGALRDERAITPLSVFLRDADPRLRAVAARSLGTLGSTAALPALHRLLEGDTDPLVVESAALAVAAIDRPESIPFLVDRLARTEGKDLRLEDTLSRSLARIAGKAFGTDAATWRAWWETVKGRPFAKPTPDPAGTTVQGLRYHEFPVRSSRIGFVVDVSRSMGWNDRLLEAKAELERVLERLPSTTRFGVTAFSDRTTAWSPRLVEAKSGAVARALAFVDRLEPETGTGTHEALRTVLSDPDVDTIFFLSDGTPSVGDVVDPDLILAEVRNLNRYRRVRIHCIAYVKGDPPAAYAGLEDQERAIRFMQRLAAENDGECKVVR